VLGLAAAFLFPFFIRNRVFTTADCGDPCRHDHAVCRVVTKKADPAKAGAADDRRKCQAERFRGIFDGRLQQGGPTARIVLFICGFGSHDGEPWFLGGKNRIKNMEKNDE